jgi:hypothetical protein
MGKLPFPQRHHSRNLSNYYKMSKLSPSLKALINAPAARPNTVPAPRNIQSIYAKIHQTAQAKNVSQSSWVALSVRQF